MGDLGGAPFGDASVQDFALAREIIEREEGLFKRDSWVITMALVEIDIVDSKPLERQVALLKDMLARQAAVVGAVAHREKDLGGEEVRIPRILRQRLADHFFRFAGRVDIGGVEKIDAEFVRPVDALLGDFGLGRPAVGQPRPQRNLADLNAILAQVAILHDKMSLRI